MWTIRGEPAGYHAGSVVWTDDIWHDGGPVLGDWPHEGVSTTLVIFNDNDLEMVPVPRIPPIDGVQVDAELRERKSNTDEAEAKAVKRLETMPRGPSMWF